MDKPVYYAVVSDFNLSSVPPVLLYVGQLRDVAIYLYSMNGILFPSTLTFAVYDDLDDIHDLLNTRENHIYYSVSLVEIPYEEVSSTYNDLHAIRSIVDAPTKNQFSI